MAFILLLEIPKHRVQLDLVGYPVGGGFRGFQNVLPGYHFLKVSDARGTDMRIELGLEAPGAGVVVRHQGGSLHVVKGGDAEEWLSRTQAMAAALIDPLAGHAATALAWQAATSALDAPAAGVRLGAGAGFEVFFARHGGNPEAALRELQAAFVRVVLLDERAVSDRFVELLGLHFGAGERRVMAHRAYFVAAAATITGMLRAVPALATVGARTVAQSEMLVEDLRDIGETRAAEALRAALAG